MRQTGLYWPSGKPCVAIPSAVSRCRPGVLTSILSLNLPYANLFNGYAPTKTTIINGPAPLHSSTCCRRFLSAEPSACSCSLPYPRQPRPPQTPWACRASFSSGPTVNRGFIKRPELKESSFVPNHLDEKQNDGQVWQQRLLSAVPALATCSAWSPAGT